MARPAFGLATLFLTVDGVRYLMANVDPRAVEEGTRGIKSALVGYALAALVPTLLSILERGALRGLEPGPYW